MNFLVYCLPFLLCLIFTPIAKAASYPAPVNIARNKMATQSSTKFNGFAHKAVDGNRDPYFRSGSCTHTDSFESEYEWWQVDLGAVFVVSNVVLFNRQDDCCGLWLLNFTINCGVANCNNSIDYETRYTETTIIGHNKTIPMENCTARYIQIERLITKRVIALCEVEVYGTELTNYNSDSCESSTTILQTATTGSDSISTTPSMSPSVTTPIKTSSVENLPTIFEGSVFSETENELPAVTSFITIEVLTSSTASESDSESSVPSYYITSLSTSSSLATSAGHVIPLDQDDDPVSESAISTTSAFSNGDSTATGNLSMTTNIELIVSSSLSLADSVTSIYGTYSTVDMTTNIELIVSSSLSLVDSVTSIYGTYSSVDMSTSYSLSDSSSTSAQASVSSSVNTTPALVYKSDSSTNAQASMSSSDNTTPAMATIDMCACSCTIADEDTEEFQKRLLALITSLTVNSTLLSKTLRKKFSVPDDRISAVSVGCMGVVIIVIWVGFFVLNDVLSGFRYIAQKFKLLIRLLMP